MIILQTLFWCVLTVFGSLHAAQAAIFRLYNGSLAKYIETPIEEPLRLLPNLDKTRNTTIYSYGFNAEAAGPATVTMISTYLSLGNTNLILLNWEKESRSFTLFNVLGYPLAVETAREIASTAGDSIVQLIENGITPNSINLVGHSLDAHLVGWIGEKVQQSNYNLSSITGLDPSGRGFGSLVIQDGLNPSQAQFVCGLHTDPGRYGVSTSVGVVDFWANCDNVYRQPGCPAGLYPPLSDNSLCSHNRAWMIYSDALRNPGSYPAALADSCSSWTSQDSSNAVINYLGSNVDPGKKGNFYFSTNSQSPYSKGADGITYN